MEILKADPLQQCVSSDSWASPIVTSAVSKDAFLDPKTAKLSAAKIHTPIPPYSITRPKPCTSAPWNTALEEAKEDTADDVSGREVTLPAAMASANACNCEACSAPGRALFKEEEIPSTRMNPIIAILMASVINRALISMPEAMPERALGTEPVVVFVTGVLVRPSPIPANSE